MRTRERQREHEIPHARVWSPCCGVEGKGERALLMCIQNLQRTPGKPEPWIYYPRMIGHGDWDIGTSVWAVQHTLALWLQGRFCGWIENKVPPPSFIFLVEWNQCHVQK